MSRAARLALLVLALAGVMVSVAAAEKAPKKPKAQRAASIAPVADSATIGLWHFDENGGPAAGDSGPYRLDATAGPETRTSFGRFNSARLFGTSRNSWAIVPYAPVLDTRPGFTIEAWVRVDSIATYELQAIAARWTPEPNQQTWLLAVTGRNQQWPVVRLGPQWFTSFRGLAPSQRLMFVYQPELASGPLAFTSIGDVPLGRWVHVAASLDGSGVKLYLEGHLDSQFTTTGSMRPGDSPLLIGNVFTPRHLTSFGGDLRMDPNADMPVTYSFMGAIDEMRLSNVVRTRFESAPQP